MKTACLSLFIVLSCMVSTAQLWEYNLDDRSKTVKLKPRPSGGFFSIIRGTGFNDGNNHLEVHSSTGRVVAKSLADYISVNDVIELANGNIVVCGRIPWDDVLIYSSLTALYDSSFNLIKEVGYWDKDDIWGEAPWPNTMLDKIVETNDGLFLGATNPEGDWFVGSDTSYLVLLDDTLGLSLYRKASPMPIVAVIAIGDSIFYASDNMLHEVDSNLYTVISRAFPARVLDVQVLGRKLIVFHESGIALCDSRLNILSSVPYVVFDVDDAELAVDNNKIVLRNSGIVSVYDTSFNRIAILGIPTTSCMSINSFLIQNDTIIYGGKLRRAFDWAYIKNIALTGETATSNAQLQILNAQLEQVEISNNGGYQSVTLAVKVEVENTGDEVIDNFRLHSNVTFRFNAFVTYWGYKANSVNLLAGGTMIIEDTVRLINNGLNLELDLYAVSPNNAISNTCTITPYEIQKLLVGIDDISKVSFSIGPNPTTGQLSISGLMENQTISIVDLNGKEIYRATELPDDIDLSHQANGFYLVRVFDSKGNTIGLEKLLLQR